MDTLFLNEQRCKCGKLLLKGLFFDGTLEIKCKKCGTINKIGSIKLADDDMHYLLIVNDKRIITNVSVSACTILGYSHEELIGKSYNQISPNLSEEISNKFFSSDSVLVQDNYFQLDTTHKTKDGKNINISALLKSYQPIEGEKQVLLSAEIKNFQAEINISDKNEREFVNNVCDFYFNIDKSGTVEYISQSAVKHIGFSQELIVGKKYFDFISLENREEIKKIFENFVANGLPYKTMDKTFTNEKGTLLDSELYFAPKYNEMGKFTGYCVLVWLK